MGDIADVTKLAGFEFTEHVVYSDEGNIIALRGLNIKNGQLILDDVKYIDGSNFSKLSRSKLFIDDIMFTYVGTVGEVAIIKENDRFYLAPNVSRIRVKSDDSPKFISHYMRTDNFKNKVIFPLIATSSQPALSMENIRKFTINIPISREEQDCLAKYFDSLDRLITLHQQKITLLTKLKKAMLEKMFPKKGSVIPEIRFKGFANAWEQRKFDEVFDCTIPSNTLSRAELNYESGSVRNIHYGDILIKYGSVVDVKNDEIPFATGKSSEDFKSALLQDGDIIIADTAEDETTGKACEIGNSQGLDVVSGLHTMVCRPRNKMALGYLGYYLNSDAYHHQLLPLMQGIKVLSLSRTNVQKTMVCYPQSKAEQQLIADCFRNLDRLITLHQRKLDMLKKLKSACLSEMFI